MSTRLKTSYFDLESILAISSPSIPLKFFKQILLLKKKKHSLLRSNNLVSCKFLMAQQKS